MKNARFSTYRIKNPYLRWACILLPPFLLIRLIWIPQVLITGWIWLLAAIMMLYSVCSIIVNVVLAIIRKLKKRDVAIGPLAVRLVRPSLVVCIYFIVSGIVRLSRESADIYGARMARQIQRICDANGLCPKTIEGWDAPNMHWVTCSTWYGEYGTHYLIRYCVSKDRKEFHIMVKHHIDESLNIEGGVEKELHARLSGPNNRAVDVNDLLPN